MRQLYMGQWVRMALALAAVLLVAGPGLVLAAGPGATYVPKSSVLIGPTTVSMGQSAQYTLRVTFNNNTTLDFPPTTPNPNVQNQLIFTAFFGTIDGAGLYHAPSAPGTPIPTKDRITGTFTQNGAKVSSSLVINVTN